MDPNNTVTNPLGNAPSSAVPTVDEPVGVVGTTVPQPIEPVAEEPTVAEPAVTETVSASDPLSSGEPTAPEPVSVDTMPGNFAGTPAVGVEEPTAEEPTEPAVGTADVKGLGGVTKPTI